MRAKHEVLSRVLCGRSVSSCTLREEAPEQAYKSSQALPACCSTSYHPKEFRALIQRTGRMT